LRANLYALGAIALWATLAGLGVALRHVPPFLLTGIGLLIGSVLALPAVLRDPAQWRIPAGTLALGVYGLFGFHFLLFMALRYAPPVEANLINYLWPLFMVVLSPLILPGVRVLPVHLLATAMGFAGAVIAILSGADTGQGLWHGGYLLALASALIWATYSLGTRRVAAFPTAAVGLFGLVSGVLSLICHAALEDTVSLVAQDWVLLALLGVGPLGAAFFLWDKALKLGDTRHIGVLSYITPLASTVLLMLLTSKPLSWSIALAAALIMGGAVLTLNTAKVTRPE
jgi:drug/metabolite transporter (DMT)-like permease